MNILIICGSPRRHGNTARIIEEIRHRLVADGISVEVCHIADYRIGGCLGCDVCQRVLDGIGCVQEDDVKMLLDKIICADKVIYGTPLYGHSYSGQLKIFLDRHVSLFKFVGDMDKAVNEMQIISLVKNKPTMLLVSCMGPEKDNTELIKMQFERFCESSLMNSLGTYVFPFCDHDAADTRLDEGCLQEVVSKCL